LQVAEEMLAKAKKTTAKKTTAKKTTAKKTTAKKTTAKKTTAKKTTAKKTTAKKSKKSTGPIVGPSRTPVPTPSETMFCTKEVLEKINSLESRRQRHSLCRNYRCKWTSGSGTCSVRPTYY